MKTKAIIALGIGAFSVVGFLVLLSFVQESARESHEEGNFCDSHRKLKWTSLVSKEGKYLLASLYARGLCVNQDIPRAMELYRSVYGDEGAKLGELLFHDALEASDADKRNGKGKRPEVLHALFAEAGKLGFVPSDKERSELERRGLQSEYGSTQSIKDN